MSCFVEFLRVTSMHCCNVRLYYTRSSCLLRYFELDFDEERSVPWGYWINRRVSKKTVDRLSLTALSTRRLLSVRLCSRFFNNDSLLQSIEESYTRHLRLCPPHFAKGLPLKIAHIAGAITLIVIAFLVGLITLFLECVHWFMSKHKA